MKRAPSQRTQALSVAKEYAEALLSSHPSASRDVIRRALAAGVSPLSIYVHVVPGALYVVGRRWQCGEISVALEHLATAEVQTVLRELAHRLPRNERTGKTAIVAAVEGELHELGPRTLADLLEGEGWEVFYAGAATPTDALVWLTQERRPDAVLLSATLSTRLPTLADAVARIRAVRRSQPFILVGGQACAGVPDIARKLGADAYETRADLAMDRLRGSYQQGDRTAAAETLTHRERDVLNLLAGGLTNFEIAERLTISVPTIKTHVGHILSKLQLRNRSEVAAFAARRSSTKSH